MTAQFAENLLYEGEEVSMCTTPLSEYFAMAGIDPRFEFNCTAHWRGYVGGWEIVDGRLYLVRLEGKLDDGKMATLETFFPGFPDRVFAHWYSGNIRIPQGDQLKYVHMGFGSTYERDLFLDIERGVVVATRLLQNGVSETASVPSGHGVGALTRISQNRDIDGESA